MHFSWGYNDKINVGRQTGGDRSLEGVGIEETAGANCFLLHLIYRIILHFVSLDVRRLRCSGSVLHLSGLTAVGKPFSPCDNEGAIALGVLYSPRSTMSPRRTCRMPHCGTCSKLACKDLLFPVFLMTSSSFSIGSIHFVVRFDFRPFPPPPPPPPPPLWAPQPRFSHKY